MKTYFKRPYEKSLTAVFYSSSDLSNELPARLNVRQRIVQPSTKEQQRLLSTSSPSRLQHVHSGKYGIRPLWPSDESSCAQWSHGRKPNKHRWSTVGSSSWKTDRDLCFSHKSDQQKKSLLSTTSFLDQPWGPLLLLASISLLLLLLVYIVCRCRRAYVDRPKTNERQRRRTSVEHPSRRSVSSEDRLSATRSLASIAEELPASITPASLSSPTTSPVLKSADKTSNGPSTLITDDSGSSHSSPASLSQRPTPAAAAADLPKAESTVQKAPTPKEEPPVTRARRSRFESDATKSSAAAETSSAPPVVVRKSSVSHQNAITDDFKSLEEIDNAVREVGLVRSQLIFGIDYTISNLETGKHSFNGLSLHHIKDGLLNPYQSVITIVGRTLEKFDSDSLIPVFGFGDRASTDRKIFPLRPDGSYCKGFRGVLEAYNDITPKVRMSGPTNFAPLIREAVRIVKQTEQYHILVIVADGQVTNERQTKDAIVEASNYPLSIVMIGVGDGPWDMMNEFDDSLPTRQFDNFQFVNYNSVVQASSNNDSAFALHALMEIPSQYAAIKALGLLKES